MKGINLKGYVDIDNISELIKTLNYMKENDIPITINTEDIVDTEGEDYYINSFSVVFPKVGGEIIPSYSYLCGRGVKMNKKLLLIIIIILLILGIFISLCMSKMIFNLIMNSSMPNWLKWIILRSY